MLTLCNNIESPRTSSTSTSLHISKIAIECDEHGHKRYHLEAEREREQFIKQQLRCTFVRYNPDAPGFNIGDVIQQIIKLIYHQHSKAINGRVS